MCPCLLAVASCHPNLRLGTSSAAWSQVPAGSDLQRLIVFGGLSPLIVRACASLIFLVDRPYGALSCLSFGTLGLLSSFISFSLCCFQIARWLLTKLVVFLIHARPQDRLQRKFLL